MSQWQRQTVSALRDQIESMSVRDVATTRDGFDKEFEALRSLDREVRSNHDEFYSAMLGSNTTKNRFTDVLPNEGTRVTLQPINSRGDGDYINANYIDARRLFGLPFVYIATQAPMRNTVFDFWRMVFENNSRFIVMLCNEIEAGKIKSERYWPLAVGSSFLVGSLLITLVDENIYEETTFRVIRISQEDGVTDARDVYHLQHTKWPDMSVPRTTGAIQDIITGLSSRQESGQYPVVVHCSGGIGRTGVFIAMHVALGLFEKEFPVSIPGIIQLLKRCRSGMVDRKDQYHFCYFGTYREMQRMISHKTRAIRGPRTHNRATERALPFGATTTAQAVNNVGPRMSTYKPTHLAQLAPAVDNLKNKNAQSPQHMPLDENRHIQFRGADQINPYLNQRHQESFNRTNPRHQSQSQPQQQQSVKNAFNFSGQQQAPEGEDELEYLRKVQGQKRQTPLAAAATPTAQSSTTITTTFMKNNNDPNSPQQQQQQQPVPMSQLASPSPRHPHQQASATAASGSDKFATL